MTKILADSNNRSSRVSLRQGWVVFIMRGGGGRVHVLLLWFCCQVCPVTSLLLSTIPSSRVSVCCSAAPLAPLSASTHRTMHPPTRAFCLAPRRRRRGRGAAARHEPLPDDGHGRQGPAHRLAPVAPHRLQVRRACCVARAAPAPAALRPLEALRRGSAGRACAASARLCCCPEGGREFQVSERPYGVPGTVCVQMFEMYPECVQTCILCISMPAAGARASTRRRSGSSSLRTSWRNCPTRSAPTRWVPSCPLCCCLFAALCAAGAPLLLRLCCPVCRCFSPGAPFAAAPVLLPRWSWSLVPRARW